MKRLPQSSTDPVRLHCSSSPSRDSGRNVGIRACFTQFRAALPACLLLLLLSPLAVSAQDAKQEDRDNKDEEGWTTIFDGKTFEGWRVNENEDTWKIVDGAFVCHGERSHLFYVGDDKPFKDFEFQCEVLTKPGSNAGIYFHTRFQRSGWPRAGFETQVNNTHGDPKKTGSLYGVVDVLKAPAEDNKWWTQHIIVSGKTVVVKVDGKTVMEYTEPDDQQPSSREFRRLIDEGTFALQGHDPNSEVHFRNIRVKRQ